MPNAETTRRLSTYLGDHLAGSAAGLATAERIADALRAGDHAPTLRRLVDELREERAFLTQVMRRLSARPPLLRQVLGAVGALGLRVRDEMPVVGRATPLQQLEALAIGVWGKRLLWGTLGRLAEADERLDDLRDDLDRLAGQAERQELDLLAVRDDVVLRDLVRGEADPAHGEQR